jgi:cytochrome c oxidase subunit 2
MRARTRLASCLRLAALLVPLALVLAGCETDDPLNTLTDRGTFSEEARSLFYLTFWIAVVIFFAVEGFLLWVLIRFRARPNRDEMPVQTHGNTRLEIFWTIVPAALLAILTIPTISKIVELSRQPDDALQLQIIGHQWWFEFRYKGPNDEDIIFANELHIPAGRKVFVKMTSVDVIHSFWVPNLAGKQDLVPNHTTQLWFDAKEPGVYQGQCAEFCGESHALMRFLVIADTEADFDEWLANQARAAPTFVSGSAARGQQIFMGNACIGCHSIKGTSATGRTAPDLTHFGSRTTIAGNRLDKSDPEHIADWIKHPPQYKPGALMPSWGTGTPGDNVKLSDDDINAVVDYLQALR